MRPGLGLLVGSLGFDVKYHPVEYSHQSSNAEMGIMLPARVVSFNPFFFRSLGMDHTAPSRYRRSTNFVEAWARSTQLPL